MKRRAPVLAAVLAGALTLTACGADANDDKPMARAEVREAARDVDSEFLPEVDEDDPNRPSEAFIGEVMRALGRAVGDIAREEKANGLSAEYYARISALYGPDMIPAIVAAAKNQERLDFFRIRPNPGDLILRNPVLVNYGPDCLALRAVVDTTQIRPRTKPVSDAQWLAGNSDPSWLVVQQGAPSQYNETGWRIVYLMSVRSGGMRTCPEQ